MSRIEKTFSRLKSENRAGLVTFIMAGHPNRDTANKVFAGLPQAGSDIIEIGMPFTDPMADGPTIQAAGLTALENGQTLKKTLADVKKFREQNQDTPIILMGYYNPIYIYGRDAFLDDALDVGVDGLIIVDLPPEEDEELCLPAHNKNIDFIRLLTPTTIGDRFGKTLQHAGGFLYYVSVNGVTGQKSADAQDLTKRISDIKKHSNMPVAVGFGIKSPKDVAATVTAGADAVVVGSAIVKKIADAKNDDDVKDILSFVSSLADATKI